MTERQQANGNSGEARIAELLAEYGRVKFRSKWDPPGGLLSWELRRYGQARFGDEWWPGSPWAYLGARAGRRAVPPARRGDQRPGGAEGA